MNKRGGGVVKVNDFESPEMKLFQGGLRNVRQNEDKLLYNDKNIRSMHDHMSYERGLITHSRSPSTQLFNFHHSYGGLQKWWLERYLKNVIYRRILRVAWAPVLGYYIFGCATMRMYDNAVYDYFYFSD